MSHGQGLGPGRPSPAPKPSGAAGYRCGAPTAPTDASSSLPGTPSHQLQAQLGELSLLQKVGPTEARVGLGVQIAGGIICVPLLGWGGGGGAAIPAPQGPLPGQPQGSRPGSFQRAQRGRLRVLGFQLKFLWSLPSPWRGAGLLPPLSAHLESPPPQAPAPAHSTPPPRSPPGHPPTAGPPWTWKGEPQKCSIDPPSPPPAQGRGLRSPCTLVPRGPARPRNES